MCIIKKNYHKIQEIDNSLYHSPMLLTLVNSVDVENSDLELFFKEIEKIANNDIKQDLLDDAKQDII